VNKYEHEYECEYEYEYELQPVMSECSRHGSVAIGKACPW